MREIKFRGKVLHNNPMVNPDDGWVEGFYYQDLVNGKISHFIRSSECEWLINPETLGQFTGLRDCNGKEIYEGDIINSEDDFIHVINYARSCACFLVTTPGDRYSTFSRILTQDWINEYQKKVIGNIHDNPGLLKGGEE